MKNKTVFKVGQDVYCGLFEKWGKVVSVKASEVLPIKVSLLNCNKYTHYTNDGRYSKAFPPTLSFTEFKIEGVNQTPPRKPYEVGDVVYEVGEKVAGKVVEITEGFAYPIMVEFKEGNDINTRTYTYEGFSCESDHLPKLSYTPYDYVNGGFT